MEKGQLITIVLVALVVAVLASVATVSVTGNVINVGASKPIALYKHLCGGTTYQYSTDTAVSGCTRVGVAAYVFLTGTSDSVYNVSEIDKKLSGLTIGNQTNFYTRAELSPFIKDMQMFKDVTNSRLDSLAGLQAQITTLKEDLGIGICHRTISLSGNESKFVGIGYNGAYTISLIGTSSPSVAKIGISSMNDPHLVLKTVTKGVTYNFVFNASGENLKVGVVDILHPAYAGDIRYIDLEVSNCML